MPVRLLKPYAGQSAGALYWGADQGVLRAAGVADDQIELATDYQEQARNVTEATATVSRNATVYNMNSASAQTLNLPLTGYWPVGTVLTVIQWGAGKTTVVGATGVTIQPGNGNLTLVTGGQYFVSQFIKSMANTWIGVGGLNG